MVHLESEIGTDLQHNFAKESLLQFTGFVAYRDVSTRNCVSKWCECEFEADSPSLHSPDRDFSSSIALHNWPVLD